MSTMSQYAEEALDKMLKRELITIVLSLQNKIIEDNNAMLQKMHKFDSNFAKLQTGNERLVLDKCPVLKKRMFRGGWKISVCR